jgi:hypothetical protein
VSQPPIVISGNEATLLHALRCIVTETMAYPPCRPASSDSYLPPDLIEIAKRALALYGQQIEPNELMRVAA